MKNRKLSLQSLLNKLDSKRKNVCNKIIADFSDEFNSLPGGLHKHQNWQGGYKNHLEEAMNIAVVLYKAMNNKRKLKFTLNQALFCLFLHDFDKLLRFKKRGTKFIKTKDYHNNFADIIKKLLKEKYGYILIADEFNAIKYAHGEIGVHHPKKRILKPLGAFVHCCDTISARIWFDKGRDSKFWD